MIDQPAVIILAAGLSERMGKEKGELRFSDEESFLDHIIHVYRRFVVSEIVLVVNKTFNSEAVQYDESIKIIVNRNLEYGRFYSIQLGLKKLKNTAVFVQNIDNPFVNLGLLMTLRHGIGLADFAVPVHKKKGGHPVLLSSNIIESIIANYQNSDRFDEVLKSFNRQDVIVNDPYVGVNINTQKDYLKYFSGL